MPHHIDVDKDYGPSIKDCWVPAPRFALRRRRILDLAKHLHTGRLLETGSGAAALLREFALKGFDCIGYDTSACASTVATQMTDDLSTIKIVDQAEINWHEAFDYLLSCDVLEHIENDQQAINQWVSYLKPGGTAIVAVPCHVRKYSLLDEWAGHIRRYDKSDFLQLINNAGLEIIHFETYGFPLASITSMLRNRIIKNKITDRQHKNAEVNTARSGIERSAECKFYHFQTNDIGRLIMRTAFALQYLFRNTELGDGFIVLAKKRHV